MFTLSCTWRKISRLGGLIRARRIECSQRPYDVAYVCDVIWKGIQLVFHVCDTKLKVILWSNKLWYLNAFYATGECRQQVKNLTKFVKNVEIVEFHDHIWNHHEKCIQISTNMPGIGSLIREIAVEISEI